jgi:hypothetical protein
MCSLVDGNNNVGNTVCSRAAFASLTSTVRRSVENCGVRVLAPATDLSHTVSGPSLRNGCAGKSTHTHAATDTRTTFLPDIFIPHDILFRDADVVVHHGGAGMLAVHTLQYRHHNTSPALWPIVH